MKITKIEIFLPKIPYQHPFRIALAVMDCAQNIIVRVHDDEGKIGIGEGSPPRFVTGESPESALVAAQLYARLLIGKDPLEIDARLSELEQYMLKNPAVRCAYDIALYDLLAKQAALPLYALLGGSNRVIHSNRTVGMDTPEAMAKMAKCFVDGGARSLKFKVGSESSDDVARTRAIRAAVGEQIALRLDANQAWDERSAISILNAIADCHVQVCEQPLPYWNVEGLQRLRGRSPVAIMADESIFDPHDAFRLAAMGAVDFFNIKLAKCAGIHNAIKINAIGEAAGIPCMLGGMAESLIGVSAGAHLICACPNITLADLDSVFHFAENPVLGGVDFHPDGTVILPDAPGHGADLHPDWIASSQKIIVGEL